MPTSRLLAASEKSSKGQPLTMRHTCHLRLDRKQRPAFRPNQPLSVQLNSLPSVPRLLGSRRFRSVTAVGVPNYATYQTNPNHLQHSKLIRLRLTLVVLRILRVPPMVRTAFLTFLLVTFVAITASAARIVPARPRAHATISKSAPRRSRSSLHPAPTNTRKRLVHSSATTSARRTTTGGHSRAASGTMYRTRNSAGHPATLRRTRYNRYHSKAHFVPLAAVPVSGSRPTSEEQDDSAATAIDSAQIAAARPRRGNDPVPDQGSTPRTVEPSGEGSAVPREADTLPAPGTDPSVMASAGNPLAAPRESRPPISSASGQVAELTRPPLFSGRVSSYTLRGTHDSLVRQNTRSEEENLERIENDVDLQDRIDRGSLVRVPESAALAVNPALPDNRRYCRPWTADFLTELAHAHRTQFHTPLMVSSAVRTVEYQMRLMRINGNAADAEGDIVSPHLTGATIDIAKSGLSRRELQWMRSELVAYQNAGVIDVEEEFHQRCFHITVYKNYGSGSPTRRSTDAAGAAATPEMDSQDTPSAASTTPDNQ